ncbi:MAG: hypothetical protein PHI19_06080 [Clostridia bacterium]|nr:hypothetical protein [Clostridia bacterium]
MEETAKRILEAVKKDDLKLFSALFEQKKGVVSLCFGRFPLLSLCYLYSANKILASFEKLLLQVGSYLAVEEDFISYKKFRNKAKTCMRLYRNKIVTPAEMLAVLGETYRLTALYPKFQKDAATEANINKIYSALHRREPKAEGEKLVISRNPLKPLLRVGIVAIIVFALIMLALPSAALANVHLLTGDGSAENPYKIMGEEQLVAAFPGEDLHFVLMRDITITAEWAPQDFAGTLEGNGHTLFFGDKVKTGWIKNLSGKISNLHIDIRQSDANIGANTGLVLTTNTGTVENVTLSLEANFTESADEDDCYLSCFALENSGTLHGCSVSAKVSLIGNGQKNTFLTGLVSWNRGSITNCVISENSEFTTDSADVSALVTENGETGVIENCSNHAAVSQTSENESWSPNSAGLVLLNIGEVKNSTNYGAVSSASSAIENKLELCVGGIVFFNYGSVLNCFNYGKISANSVGAEIYIGGIVCKNNNYINKCKNDGELEVSAENSLLWLGGVSALNNSLALVDFSCSHGEVNLLSAPENTSNGLFYFCGGLLGQNNGVIKNSYSTVSYSTVVENDYLLLGGISGTSRNLNNENNYYLARTNIGYGNASYILNFTIYPGGDDGITVLSSLDQLKEQEVYWG